jgi:ATP-dependent exoDNAse (exonuclease V) alpha subunit
VAIFYLEVKLFGRGAGSCAVSAAAYRAGERIRDERTSRTFDHSHRNDVMHKEIVLPARFAAADMSRFHDRAWLWNAVELAETRANAALAREYLIALPHELTHPQRVGLVQTFAHELAERHVFAVDLVIHAPRPHNDPRNYHAHLLTTRREVSPAGLGARIGMDLQWSPQLQERGINSTLKDIHVVRERWATLANQALREANVDARIDHRSLKAQGVDREPIPHIPVAARSMEARGQHSEIAERIRKAYRARVQARLARAIANPSGPPGAAKLDDLRQLARQSWLQLRRMPGGTSAATLRARTQEFDNAKGAGRTGEEQTDDYGL